jgi:hypothetical protein
MNNKKSAFPVGLAAALSSDESLRNRVLESASVVNIGFRRFVTFVFCLVVAMPSVLVSVLISELYTWHMVVAYVIAMMALAYKAASILNTFVLTIFIANRIAGAAEFIGTVEDMGDNTKQQGE